MSKTYAVASAKGGVGKTTTVANLGVALAGAGADVVVVDADIGMANLAGALGVEPAGPTLHTVLAGDADVADAIYEGPAGLAVLPGSPDLVDYRDADPSGLAELIDELRGQYEYVLLDTGAGLSHDAVIPLGLADEVLLVSTPQRDALGDTDKTRELVERLGGTVAGLVLTRVPEGADVDDTPADRVDADVLELVPDDPEVDEAIAAGEPIVRYAPDSPAAAAYRRLAANLTDLAVARAESARGAEEVESEAAAEGEPEEVEEGEDGEEASEEGETAEERAAEEDDTETAAVESETEEAESKGTESEEAESAESEAEAEVEEEAEAAESEAETAASEEESAESEEAAGESESPPIAEAEPRKSVGPRRDEHVPVRDGEELEEVDEAEESQESSLEEEEEEKEKKGFFSRLLGR